jgi:predicted secreted protein
MAASTEPINGTAYIIEISDDDGVTWAGLAHAQDASVTRSMATRDTTSKSSAGWRNLGSGLRQWGMSGSGLVVYDGDDLLTPSDFKGFLDARTKLKVRFTTANAGDLRETGNAFLTQFDSEAPVEENMTYSFTFEGDGALEDAVVS